MIRKLVIRIEDLHKSSLEVILEGIHRAMSIECCEDRCLKDRLDAKQDLCDAADVLQEEITHRNFKSNT